MKFNLFDEVEYAGMKGHVVGIDTDDNYPIRAKFTDADGDPLVATFTMDGYFSSSHKAPLLKLLSCHNDQKKYIKAFRQFYFKNGKVCEYLATINGKMVDGSDIPYNFKDDFGGWLGHTVPIEVNW